LESRIYSGLCVRATVQLLFSTDFTQSLQQDWRSGQFSCRRCGSSLVGQRYILRDDQPYCKKCYDELFAHTCVACKTLITTDYKVCLSESQQQTHEYRESSSSFSNQHAAAVRQCQCQSYIYIAQKGKGKGADT